MYAVKISNLEKKLVLVLVLVLRKWALLYKILISLFSSDVFRNVC